MRKHVIITGTGRAGTSFLVQLLTHAGLDTGFTIEDVHVKTDNKARAGLETDARHDDAPYVVKSPFFCDYVDEIIGRDDVVIEHVFVPVRNLEAAAQSRRQVQEDTVEEMPLLKKVKYKVKGKTVAGGVWDAKEESQENVLMRKLYDLILGISNTHIPVTLMQYPRITKDSRYLYDKFLPILGDMTYETFDEAFKQVVRPDLVHSFNEKDK